MKNCKEKMRLPTSVHLCVCAGMCAGLLEGRTFKYKGKWQKNPEHNTQFKICSTIINHGM